MATSDEDVVEALDAAILSLAKTVGSATVGARAEEYSVAALHLAEARAWFHNPSQPHGGNMSVSVRG